MTDVARAEYLAVPPPLLTNEASLVLLDVERVCFQVTLRTDQFRPEHASLESWRVFLRAPGFENLQPVFGPPAEPAMQQVPGSVPRQHFAGYYNSCGRIGAVYTCTPQPRYVVVREPMVVSMTATRQAVCFGHGGQITRATEQLTLHLDDPDDMSTRVAFRWRLVR